MPEYGIGTPAGRVGFTGYSNSLGIGQNQLPVTVGYVSFNGMTQQDQKLSHLLRTRGSRVLRTIVRTLINGAVGDNATDAYARVKPLVLINTAQGGGGLVTVETTNAINRVTTNTDKTNAMAALSRAVFPTTYAVDLSGNGAGHRAGW